MWKYYYDPNSWNFNEVGLLKEQNMWIVEVCPKCNCEIKSICVSTNPNQYQKVCSECGWKGEVSNTPILYHKTIEVLD